MDGDEIDDDDDCRALRSVNRAFFFFNAWPWLETFQITIEQRNAIHFE